MSNCYKIISLGCDNVTRTFFICGDSYEFRPGGVCGGGIGYLNGAVFVNPTYASAKSQSISVVANSNCTNCAENIPTNQPYDCVNGACLPSSTYGTPGAFATRSACDSGCAKNSNCTGECVDPAEIANLRQAITTLQSKICK
jgi:hypothetical protein